MLDAPTGRKVSHSGVDVTEAIHMVVEADTIVRQKGCVTDQCKAGGRIIGKRRLVLVLQAIDEWQAYGRAVEAYWTQCKAGTSNNDTDPRQPACRKLFATLEALQALL